MSGQKRTWMLVAAGVLLIAGCRKEEVLVPPEPATAPMEEASVQKHTNKLVHETSPYLLQHAHNPVNWYPWGDEALAKAKAEDKPIFLSIGYSSCHWCHVMERESFENETIAGMLNASFIPIKVDREERPDIDAIYMDAVQALTGRGGWPLSVFLTPDLKPFYGGTYFPKEDHYGLPGFGTVLGSIADFWATRRDEAYASADEITRAIHSRTRPVGGVGEQLSAAPIEKVVRQLKQSFDARWGGFGGAPKFPQSGAIGILLRHYQRTGDEEALHAATHTLDRMAYGGLYDQVGGGFHRYSVDERWLVPHFEKMLYDNAQLSRVYLDAYLLTGDPLYERITRETLNYILREMTDDSGGFQSAQDADSEGVEGKFYVWSVQEIDKVLGLDASKLFKAYYGITVRGNFEGDNIPNVVVDPRAFAQSQDLSIDELNGLLRKSRETLLNVRAKRVPPRKDIKVLVAWNGMMISSFVTAGAALDKERYVIAGVRAGEFIWNEMFSEKGLKHVYASDRTYISAYLDDYSEFANALVDLYEATHELKWLERAEKVSDQMIDRLWDDEQGAFYQAVDQDDLIVRKKPLVDGSVPSGNAVAALVLQRLGVFFDRKDYRAKAERVLSFGGPSMTAVPAGHTHLLKALDFTLYSPTEIAIVGTRYSEDTRQLLAAVNRRFIAHRILAVMDPDSPAASDVVNRIPLLAYKTMVDGKAAAYVCENYACRAPVSDVRELVAELGPRTGPDSVRH